MTRPRFTIRSLMIAVAISGTISGAVALLSRHNRDVLVPVAVLVIMSIGGLLAVLAYMALCGAVMFAASRLRKLMKSARAGSGSSE